MGEPNKVPLPPGAEVVVEPPAEQAVDVKKPSWLARAWAVIKAKAEAASSAARIAVFWTGTQLFRGASWIVDKLSWVYERTLGPALLFIETWVPGMRYLRQTMLVYGVSLVAIGAVMGAVIFGANGFFWALAGLFIGAALLPVLVIITPAVWGQVALDLALISFLMAGFCVLAEWMGGAPFVTALGHQLAPGWTYWIEHGKPELLLNYV